MKRKRAFVQTRRYQPSEMFCVAALSRWELHTRGCYFRQWQSTGSCAATQLKLEEAKGQGHGFEEAKRGWFASPRDGEADGDSCLEMPSAHLP